MFEREYGRRGGVVEIDAIADPGRVAAIAAAVRTGD